MVVIDHIQKLILHRAVSWLPTGQHGVTVFFVLSGFLITGKLLGPETDIRRFYLRRLFRLMPVAWIFLVVAWAGGFRQYGGYRIPLDVPTCVFFVRNYFDNLGSGVTMHYWSLSIEEQFYFVWPMALLMTGARRARWLALSGAWLVGPGT